MTNQASFTLRAQWLGQALRDLREASQLTLKEPADYIQRSNATLSRFESGEYPIRRPDVLALLDFYGLTDKHKRDGLLGLADSVWQKGWWDEEFTDAVYDRKFVDYVWLESRSTEIRSFDSTTMIGLLQTADYARAVITASESDPSPEQVDRWVELRLARQQILVNEKPVLLKVVLDEALLHREVGGRAALRAQLKYLLACADAPNIEIRVLPFAAGAHSSLPGAFRLLLMPEPYPEAGYAETLAGAIYVEPPKTGKLLTAYDGLQRSALGLKKSVEAISAVLKE